MGAFFCRWKLTRKNHVHRNHWHEFFTGVGLRKECLVGGWMEVGHQNKNTHIREGASPTRLVVSMVVMLAGHFS